VSKEAVLLEKPEQTTHDEVEAYRGEIEWHRFADGGGRLFRFGLVELSEEAGKRFLGGANDQYKLVLLQDVNGVSIAYPFKVGNGGSNDYLAPEYVYEKLGKALYFQKDTLEFTKKLGELLGRPTPNGRRAK
jgi:fido (protein-threonine AMPylation protein)